MELSTDDNSENELYLDYDEADDQSTESNSVADHEYLELSCSEDEDDLKSEATSIAGESDPQTSNNMYVVLVSNDNKKYLRFHCELCNITFLTSEEVSNHMLTHDADSCVKCGVCDNIMKKSMYDIHVKLHRAAFKLRPSNQKVACTKCGKYMNKPYLKIHMKKHAKVQPENSVQCSICGKVLSSQYFNEHMQRVHDKNFTTEKKEIECPVCDKVFKANSFKKHLEGHGRHPKQYICDQCGKVFRQGSTFKTHVLTHGAELKYKCQFCPYKGLHLGLLKIHVRTHTKDYAYECSTCNKKFITKSNLSMHERRHRPPEFICEVCNKGFYSKRCLTWHNNSQHLNIRDMKCDICGKTFVNKTGLQNHQRRAHNMKVKIHDRVGRLPSYLKEKYNKQNTDREQVVH